MAALADQKAASAEIKEARSGLLPKIVFSESATRGNDPVYAFGTRLRQGRFTADDFALNRLNYPPDRRFTTRFSGQWTLFDSFANLLRCAVRKRCRKPRPGNSSVPTRKLCSA